MTYFFLTSEKLPKNDQKVLIVTTKNINEIQTATYKIFTKFGWPDTVKSEGVFVNSSDEKIIMAEIIGWMPLPSTKTILKKWLDTVKE